MQGCACLEFWRWHSPECPDIAIHGAEPPDVDPTDAPTVADLRAELARVTAERDLYRDQRDHEAYMHAACLCIAEISDPSCGPDFKHSLATEAVLKIKTERDAATARATAAEATIARVRAEAAQLSVSGCETDECARLGSCICGTARVRAAGTRIAFAIGGANV